MNATNFDLDSLATGGSGSYLVHGLTLVDPELGVMNDAALAIDGNKIIAVGPLATLSVQVPQARQVAASGYLATPALINAHTHAALNFFRGLGHGHKHMIETVLFPAEKRLTPELLEPLAYGFFFNAMRNGIGTVADHYYFSEGVARAAERLGLRAVIGETVADLGGAFPGEASWHRARGLIERWPFGARITPQVAPHATDTVSAKLLQETARYARARGIPLHMHLSQTGYERERVLKREGLSPVAYAERCQALGPLTLAVHLVSADAEDLALLARTESTAVVCPASQIIYERLAPLLPIRDAKVPLAIATDCAASDDDGDVLAALKLTGLLARDRSDNQASIAPLELLRAATRTPAQALGLGTTTGCLRAGMAADIAFWRIGLQHEPLLSPAANLIYSFNGRDCTHLMVDGRLIMRHGEPTLASSADLRAAHLDAVQTILKRIGHL